MKKKILMIFVLSVLLISFVNADLNDTDLVAYWSYDVNANDDKNSEDFTVSGSTHNTTSCLLGSGCYNMDGNDWNYRADDASFDSLSAMSWGGWYYRIDNSGVSADGLLCKDEGASQSRGWNMAWSETSHAGTPNQLCCRVWTDTGDTNLCSVSTYDINSWYFFVCTWDGTNIRIYVNGTLVNSDTRDGTAVNSGSQITDGIYYYNSGTTNVYDGLSDDKFFYKRNITDTEITALYNSGNGCNPVTTDCQAAPTASLTLSTNLTSGNYTTNPFRFSFNGTATNTDDDNFNCTFYRNGTINSTLTLINISDNHEFNLTGEYNETFNFTVSCENNNASDSFEAIIDIDNIPPPSMNLSTNLSTANYTTNPFTFAFNGTVANTDSDTFNCTFYVNGTENASMDLIEITDNNVFNFSGSFEAGYNLNVTCENNNASDSFSYYVYIDNILPDIDITTNFVNNSEYVIYPTTSVIYNVTINDSNLYAINHTIKKTTTNGTNITITTVNNIYFENLNITSIQINISNATEDFGVGNFTINVTAWDSHTTNRVRPIQWFLRDDKISVNDYLWIYGDLKYYNEKNDLITYLYLSEDKTKYKLKVTFNEDSLYHSFYLESNEVLTYLPYSDYDGHFVLFDHGMWIDFVSEDIKDISVSDLGNNLFKIDVEHYEITDEIELESIGDLNVESLEWRFNISGDVYDCSVVAGDYPSVNFTLHDEDSFDLIYGDISIDLTYGGGNVISVERENTTYLTLCVGDPDGFNVTGTVRSEASYLNKKFYFTALINGTLQDVSLYNYNSSTGKSVLKWFLRDETWDVIPNRIGKMQRYYPANHTWLTVQEDQTGEFGLLVFHVKEETTEYRFRFYNNATLLKSTDDVKFVCDSGVCEVTSQIIPTETDEVDINANWSFNNATKLLTVDWNDASGATSYVRTELVQSTVTGNTVICNSTVYSASGSYSCNTTGYYGDAILTVRGSASPAIIKVRRYITLTPFGKIYDFIDNAESAIWSFGMALSMLSIGLSGSPVMVFIIFVFGLIIQSYLGIISLISAQFLGLVVIIGVAIALKVRK